MSDVYEHGAVRLCGLEDGDLELVVRAAKAGDSWGSFGWKEEGSVERLRGDLSAERVEMFRAEFKGKRIGFAVIARDETEPYIDLLMTSTKPWPGAVEQCAVACLAKRVFEDPQTPRFYFYLDREDFEQREEMVRASGFRPVVDDWAEQQGQVLIALERGEAGELLG